MRALESKIKTLEELVRVTSECRAKGKKVVTTNGCFDILHLGHLRYLEKARELGDVLVCAVNSDRSVKKLKGLSRPLQAESVRALQLAALESVDYVCIFNEDTPEAFLSKLQPAIHAKGGDYKPEDLPERMVVEAGGGKVVCLNLESGFSTTSLIEKIRS